MANRRKFIAGLGALATGSAAAVGTGAFSFMNAQRTVSVDVAGDSSAFLGIETSQSKYATGADSGTAEITLNADSGGSGDGINANADTRFDNVLVLRNNGDRDVTVIVDDDSAEDDAFQVWVSDSSVASGGSLTRVDDGTPFRLGDGEKAHLSVGTFLRDHSESDLPENLTFTVDTSNPGDAVEPQ